MMKAFKEPINYQGLEEELHEALRADELYSLQNDAKFRAIEQSVPTYEDFRQMVNAAHLKPLDRKDMTPKVGVKWNAIANDKKYSQSIRKGSGNNYDRHDQSFPESIPKKRHEFLKIWKNLNYNNKFRLLNETRLFLIRDIFRTDIPPDILIDCVVTCLESLTVPGNDILVIEILSTLTECKRFKLAIEFMSLADKSICHELFEALRRSKNIENKTVVDTLARKYIY